MIIGASGLHLLVSGNPRPAQLGDFGIDGRPGPYPADEVPEVYNETFGGLQAISSLGLFFLGLTDWRMNWGAHGRGCPSVLRRCYGVVLPFALAPSAMTIFHGCDSGDLCWRLNDDQRRDHGQRVR